MHERIGIVKNKLLIFNVLFKTCKKILKKVCEKEKVCTFAHPKTEGKDERRGGKIEYIEMIV